VRRGYDIVNHRLGGKAVAAEEVPDYHSPKRCLARSFRLSRDRWKGKAADRLATIHSVRVRVRDLALSRDLWKRKAICYQDLLRQAGLLPAADILPPDDFALAPPLPAEVAAVEGEVSVAEAATNSPAGAPIPPGPAAEFVAALESARVPELLAQPPAIPALKKKRPRAAVDA
jgi:hypothetical protein